MEPHQVNPRRRDQDGELLQELEPAHHELVAPAHGALHAIAITPVVVARQPPERERPTRAVAAQPLDAGAIVLVQAHATVERESVEERLEAPARPRDVDARPA